MLLCLADDEGGDGHRARVWVRANDTHVERVSEAEVLDTEAYLLFYMRGDLPDDQLVCGDRRAPSSLFYPL